MKNNNNLTLTLFNTKQVTCFVKPMSRVMGHTFTAKVNYPLGMEPSEVSLDAHVGEILQIIEYREKTNEYKLLNTSLGALEAWFIVSAQDLMTLMYTEQLENNTTVTLTTYGKDSNTDIEFTVSVEWLKHIIDIPLNEFLSTYTFDDSEIIYELAKEKLQQTEQNILLQVKAKLFDEINVLFKETKHGNLCEFDFSDQIIEILSKYESK